MFVASLFSAIALSGSLGASCGETPGDFCEPCVRGKERYSCTYYPVLTPTTPTTVYACRSSEFDANQWCAGYDPEVSATPSNCDNADDGGLETGETTWGSEPWDPASEVNYNVGTDEYEIDADFIAALVEDGFAPLSLDSARLVYSGVGGYSGYYELDNVASGDLADELGLQDGDILKSVNGYELDTVDHQMQAYEALKNETDLELRIRRSSNFVTIAYKIVP
jgi:hypothetical protein